MPQVYPRKSATILSFQERARALRPRSATPAPTPDPAPVPAIVFGGAWYHDEAIREQDPLRKS